LLPPIFSVLNSNSRRFVNGSKKESRWARQILSALGKGHRYSSWNTKDATSMKLRSILVAGFLASSIGFSSFAVDAKVDKEKKGATAKPYLLKTCIVSGDKLGGDMGAPYVFTYQGREIKMCCKDCRKDFDKSPAKYLKKLDAAEKKAKAADQK
jgi:YHS domain-containing protein